jgi:hypothetical protein
MKNTIKLNESTENKFDILMKNIIPLLENFLQEKNLKFEVNKSIPTFAFSPFEKKILI